MKGGRKTKKMMKSKRSQGEIITTVLIILVVLAAVAIVATFIIRTVRTSTGTAEEKAQCLSIEASIERAVKNETNVSVKRGVGGSGVNLSNVRVYVDGAWKANITAIIPLETKSVDTNVTLASGSIVEIAPVLSTGTLCDIKDKVTVA